MNIYRRWNIFTLNSLRMSYFTLYAWACAQLINFQVYNDLSFSQLQFLWWSQSIVSFLSSWKEQLFLHRFIFYALNCWFGYIRLIEGASFSSAQAMKTKAHYRPSALTKLIKYLSFTGETAVNQISHVNMYLCLCTDDSLIPTSFFTTASENKNISGHWKFNFAH